MSNFFTIHISRRHPLYGRVLYEYYRNEMFKIDREYRLRTKKQNKLLLKINVD